MSILIAALLGLVQGITEFLPISSSGHLSVLQNLFHMQSVKKVDIFFEVLLHLATLISISVVYWQDIVDMIKSSSGFSPISVTRSPMRAFQSPHAGLYL